MEGVWRQEVKGRRVLVTIEPFAGPPPAWARRAAEAEAERLAAFSRRPAGAALGRPSLGVAVKAPLATARRYRPGSSARATGTSPYGLGTYASGRRSRQTPRIVSATLSSVETIQRVQGRASSSRWGKPSVGTNPGWTRLMWTPWRASSMATASVQPARANLLAEYDPTRGRDARPATLPMFTTPLGAERRSSGSRASVRRTCGVEVDRHDPADLGPAALGEAPPPADPGVVDQQVEAAVLVGDPVGDQRRGRLLEQVGGDHGGPADLGRQLVQPFAAPGHQHQPGAGLGRQPARRGRPDPAGRARDQGDHAAPVRPRRPARAAATRSVTSSRSPLASTLASSPRAS